MFKFTSGFFLGALVMFIYSVYTFVRAPWQSIVDLKYFVDHVEK